MKKVFNLRIECDSPTFVMADKEFCKGLEEVVADEFDEEMKYVKLKAEACDKDRQIADLEKQLAEKDKEIEKIKKSFNQMRFMKNDKIKLLKEREIEYKQQIRHQVCEEIRKKLRESSILTQDRYIAETILNEIEGENDERAGQT